MKETGQPRQQIPFELTTTQIVHEDGLCRQNNNNKKNQNLLPHSLAKVFYLSREAGKFGHSCDGYLCQTSKRPYAEGV